MPSKKDDWEITDGWSCFRVLDKRDADELINTQGATWCSNARHEMCLKQKECDEPHLGICGALHSFLKQNGIEPKNKNGGLFDKSASSKADWDTAKRLQRRNLKLCRHLAIVVCKAS
jgi:hypothetical protein